MKWAILLLVVIGLVAMTCVLIGRHAATYDGEDDL